MGVRPGARRLLAARGAWRSGPSGDPSPVGAAWGHNVLAFAFWRARMPQDAAEHLAVTRTALARGRGNYLGDASEAHAAAQGWLRKNE